MIRPLAPVAVRDLFEPERDALLELLASLDGEAWSRSTVCPGWTVKDIAAHILGDDLGRLSGQRDGFAYGRLSGQPSWDELIAFINGRNDTWVEAMRRLSPRVLIDLLRDSGRATHELIASLDLDALGGPVDWAGPGRAPVWLDVAREYTERWAHQQQIRDAVRRPGLKDRRFFGPVLDTFIRALPHTFRDVAAPDGAAIVVRISGDAGGEWTLRPGDARWALYAGASDTPTAEVTIGQEHAWRLMTKGLAKPDAVASARIEGDRRLADRVFDVLSILA